MSPYSHYYNTNLQNKSYHTFYIDFNITIDMDCKLCETIDSYSNQSKGINFSHLVIVAILGDGINHHAMQIALAVIGIIIQNCK